MAQKEKQTRTQKCCRDNKSKKKIMKTQRLTHGKEKPSQKVVINLEVLNFQH